MGSLDGRVAIVTGAGRGLGREHALLLAAEGAQVVVNDVGAAADGSGADRSPAEQVVAEIVAAGGAAVLNTDSVSDWDGARRLVATAVGTFGDLHVLVNNAGVLRDRMLATMSEDEWDTVIAVHLKGHAGPTRWALAHWREQAKSGRAVSASVVHTSSVAGLAGNVGQTNYGAAKAGIAAMTVIGALEAGRYGVRMNAIAPVAQTRMTMSVMADAEPAAGADDPFHPACVSPLVAYLAAAGCPVTGGVFHVAGNQVGLYTGWQLDAVIEGDGRWDVDGLARAVPGLIDATAGGLASQRLDMDSFTTTLARVGPQSPRALPT